ncbi:hypothetical protein ES707_13287 [subsurface metagenome]
MSLIRTPKRPHWKSLVRYTLDNVVEESWKDFLDLAYWNVELEQDEK